MIRVISFVVGVVFAGVLLIAMIGNLSTYFTSNTAENGFLILLVQLRKVPLLADTTTRQAEYSNTPRHMG